RTKEKSSSNTAKTRTTASEAQTSSIDDAGDKYVNPAAGKPRNGGDENGRLKVRASDTLASFSADSTASTLTPLLLTAAWLALAI
ncbi:hypothetical protein LPJ70_003853, partial [Coemansia sp. RSA 2708]